MISKIYIEDFEIVKKYIDECMEALRGIEKGILELEMNSVDLDLQNLLFRSINKIKTGSSFFGLAGLTRLTYEMEFILKMIKHRNMTAKTEHIDSLLLCVDFLNTYIKRLRKELEEYNLSDKNIAMYFEFATSAKEDQILDSLELEHNTFEEESKENTIRQEQALEENTGFDILLAENFQSGLADDVREQFLIENTEHLDTMENDILIRLDSDKNNREAINELFRLVHSIKGGTGIYLATLSGDSQLYSDVKKFQEVVHTFESLLSLVRDRQCSFEKNLVDLSLKVIDFLRTFLRAVELDASSIDTDPGILDSINQEMLSIQSLPVITDHDNTPVIRKETEKSEDTRLKDSVTQSIRVHQDKIDIMMNIISELVIAKNSFAHISDKLNMEYNLPEISKEVKQVGAYVNRISDELQNSIMSIRMVEIKTVFQRMPRVIRDIAHSTGKKMELIMEGEHTEIDKSIIEQISDPLVHIIRNSADHGIETPKERVEKEKPETGKIILRAYNKNKYVFIEVEDDGKGMNAERIKEKAIEKGIISEMEAERMNQSQLINLIFLPGFSMAEKITEVSGRGVGMDIVKSNISKINGNITVESEVDKGTKLTIRLPLSLAVSHGLIVEVSGENYIIPLENIIETVKINRSNIHKFNEKYFTYLRGTVIGMEWLSKIFLLGERDMEKDEFNAVILSNGDENYAIVVDKLKNEQEFVMKTLGGHLSAIPGISGSTLLGNGQVVLVVNPIDLLKLAGL